MWTGVDTVGVLRVWNVPPVPPGGTWSPFRYKDLLPSSFPVLLGATEKVLFPRSKWGPSRVNLRDWTGAG